ncbi:MAG: hypothetical protein KC464_27070 [Myxococcales bacterium]|nr:hypothetical protein [Myxococcales bacterium]
MSGFRGPLMWTPQQALALLASLDGLRFPEELFREIHPSGHSMKRFRNYCRGTQRFNRSSSSHGLCGRIERLADLARLEDASTLDVAKWRSLVASALAACSVAARTSTAEAADAPKSIAYRRLGGQHQRFIAEQIFQLAVVARDGTNAMRQVARWQIKNTLWRWTVDGVDATGLVCIDAAKRTPGLLPATRQAHEAMCSAHPRVVHEHVVPRSLLTDYVLKHERMTAEAICEFLRHHCLSAVVTREQDGVLNARGLREKMPDGWCWGGDPWVRYREVGLFDELLWPEDWS